MKYLCPNCGSIYTKEEITYNGYISKWCEFCFKLKESPADCMLEVMEEATKKYIEQFVDVKDIAIGDKNEFSKTRDCHKCVYEVGCHGNPVNCKAYKRDTPDGGYYG